MSASSPEFNKLLRVFSLLTCALYHPHSFSLNDLQSYGYPPNKTLSKETVKKHKQRDIATLKSLGISLAWDDTVKPGVYHVTSHIFMRPFTLTEEQLHELTVVTNILGKLPLPDQPHASVGLCRILHAHNQNSRRMTRFTSFNADTSSAQSQTWEISQELAPEMRSVIDTALTNNLNISLKYAGGSRRGQVRKVYPRSYFMRENISYLSCYDYDSSENRCYRLDRILNVQATKETADPEVIKGELLPDQMGALPFQLFGTPTPYTVLFWPARVEHLHTNACSHDQFSNVEALIDDQQVKGVAWSTEATSLPSLYRWLFEKVSDTRFIVLTPDGQICSPAPYINSAKEQVLKVQAMVSNIDTAPVLQALTPSLDHQSPQSAQQHHNTRPLQNTPSALRGLPSRKKSSTEAVIRRLFVPLCALGLPRYQEELDMLIDAAADDFADMQAVQTVAAQLQLNAVSTSAEDLILMWRLITALADQITDQKIVDSLEPERELLNKFATLALTAEEAQAIARAFALCQPGIDTPLLRHIKSYALSHESILALPPDVTEYLSFTDLASRIQTLTKAFQNNALVTCEYTTQYRNTSKRQLYLAAAPVMRNGIYYVDAYEGERQTIKSYRVAQMNELSVSGLQAKKVPHAKLHEATEMFQNLVDSNKNEVVPVVFAVDPHIARSIGSKVHFCYPATKEELAPLMKHARIMRAIDRNKQLLTILWNTHSAWLPQYCARMLGHVIGLQEDFLEQTAIELDLILEDQPTSVSLLSEPIT